jgi:hypothetical protein
MDHCHLGSTWIKINGTAESPWHLYRRCLLVTVTKMGITTVLKIHAVSVMTNGLSMKIRSKGQL